LVPAGEPTAPMNRNVNIFAFVFHEDHDPFYQVPDDLLAIPMGRARCVPERGEIRGESRDPRPLLVRELRGLFAEKAVVIVADLRPKHVCSVPSWRCRTQL